MLSDAIRVAHVTTIDMSLSYLLRNQLASLQAAGYEVTGISAPGPYVADLAEAGIRHVAVPMTRTVTPLRDLLALFRLFRLFRRERFTIVHTHNPKPGLLGQLAARMARVPVVVNTLHGFYFHEHMPPARRTFFVRSEALAARCSDAILSQNREDAETAIRERICRPEQIHVLGNGIDVARFDRSQLTDAEVAHTRQDLGLAPSHRVVGFVGRLVEEKGLRELMQAFRRVRRQFPDARLLIVGPADPEKPDALSPATANDLGIGDACIFAGLRQDMPALYALMDVFVLPSHREGFPRSPMEASAMGVPCVVTDVRGCRETVEAGRNGVLVPLRDAPALANAITDLLAHPEKAARMGHEGRRLAQERFDERRVFDTVRETYARLLREKGLLVPEGTTTNGVS